MAEIRLSNSILLAMNTKVDIIAKDAIDEVNQIHYFLDRGDTIGNFHIT